METLYVIVTKNCQLHCPFCCNDFVDTFKQCNSSHIQADMAISTIKATNPEAVNFIGGEPLLYPQTLIDIMNPFKEQDIKNKNRMWAIATNLYYNELSDLQIQALLQMQEQSSDHITIGSSYSYDRFYGKDKYLDIFKENMLRLDHEGIRCGVTITLTEPQITKMTVDDTIELLQSVKCKMYNVERCIYSLPTSDLQRRHQEMIYNKQDEYMREFFMKIPKEMNHQWSRIRDAVYYRIPWFPMKCSKDIFCLYDHGMYPGCISNELSCKPNYKDKAEKMLYDKWNVLNCTMCSYYPYCKGDCECNRLPVCSFPKKTFDYVKELVMKEIKDNK